MKIKCYYPNKCLNDKKANKFIADMKKFSSLDRSNQPHSPNAQSRARRQLFNFMKERGEETCREKLHSSGGCFMWFKERSCL